MNRSNRLHRIDILMCLFLAASAVGGIVAVIDIYNIAGYGEWLPILIAVASFLLGMALAQPLARDKNMIERQHEDSELIRQVLAEERERLTAEIKAELHRN